MTARGGWRDESGSDGCGRVEVSTVAGLERYLGDASIQFVDVLGTGVREEEASRGLQVWGHKQILLPGRKALEEGKWACGKKMEGQIWDVLCFGVPMRYPSRSSVLRAVEYMDLELRRDIWDGREIQVAVTVVCKWQCYERHMSAWWRGLQGIGILPREP